MQRQSNIELCRIVAMSFILILHFFIHSITIDNMNPWVFQGLVIANICGVNLFVIISGYFGINGSVKSFVKLWLMIAFYSLICLLIGNLMFGMPISLAKLVKSFIMPFTSEYWFLECYLGLYILAPVINKGLKLLSAHELRNIILLMTVISAFSCWYGRNMIGNNGYSLYHFIYIYIFGYFLRVGGIKWERHKWMMIAVLSLVLNIGITYVFDFISNSFDNRYWNENAIAYNNPFIIAASVSIFMCFSKLQLRPNKYINSFAAAAHGCYLLQDGFIRIPIYELQRNYMISSSLENTILMYFISYISLWVISYIIMKIYTFLYQEWCYYCKKKTPIVQ